MDMQGLGLGGGIALGDLRGDWRCEFYWIVWPQLGLMSLSVL